MGANSQTTEIFRQRMNWTLEEVERHRMVSDVAMRRAIATMERSNSALLDKTTGMRLFKAMEDKKLLVILRLAIPSKTGGVSNQKVTLLLHPSLDPQDTEVQRMAITLSLNRKTNRPSQYYSRKRRSSKEAFEKRPSSQKAAVMPSVFRVLCGYVRGRVIQAYILHKHLVALVKGTAGSSGVGADSTKIALRDAIEEMPVSLYFQICGAPVQLNRDFIFDENNHATKLRSVGPYVYAQIRERGFKGFSCALNFLRRLGLVQYSISSRKKEAGSALASPSIPALSPATGPLAGDDCPPFSLNGNEPEVSNGVPTNPDDPPEESIAQSCVQVASVGKVGAEEVNILHDDEGVEEYWGVLRQVCTLARYHQEEKLPKGLARKTFPEIYNGNQWQYFHDFTTKKGRDCFDRLPKSKNIAVREIIKHACKSGQSASVVATHLAMRLLPFAKRLVAETSFMNQTFMKNLHATRRRERRKRNRESNPRKPPVPTPPGRQRVQFNFGDRKRNEDVGPDDLTKYGELRKRQRFSNMWKRQDNARCLILYNRWRDLEAIGARTDSSFANVISQRLGINTDQANRGFFRLTGVNSRTVLAETKSVLSHYRPLTGLAYHGIPHNNDEIYSHEMGKRIEGTQFKLASEPGTGVARVEAACNLLKVIHFQSEDQYDPALARKALKPFSHDELQQAISLMQCRGITVRRALADSSRTHKVHHFIHEAMDLTHYKSSTMAKAREFQRRVDAKRPGKGLKQNDEIQIATRNPGQVAGAFPLALDGDLEMIPNAESGIEQLSSEDPLAKCGALEASVQVFRRKRTRTTLSLGETLTRSLDAFDWGVSDVDVHQLENIVFRKVDGGGEEGCLDESLRELVQRELPMKRPVEILQATCSVIRALEQKGKITRVETNRVIAENYSGVWKRPNEQGKPTVVRPWSMLCKGAAIKPNDQLLRRIKTSVASLIATFPGISLSEIQTRVSFLAKWEILDILNMLKSEGRVKMKVYELGKPSLFSSPKDTLKGTCRFAMFPTTKVL